jgi:hypothetical protein
MYINKDDFNYIFKIIKTHENDEFIHANINDNVFHDIIIYCLENNISYKTFIQCVNSLASFIDPENKIPKELTFDRFNTESPIELSLLDSNGQCSARIVYNIQKFNTFKKNIKLIRDLSMFRFLNSLNTKIVN